MVDDFDIEGARWVAIEHMGSLYEEQINAASVVPVFRHRARPSAPDFKELPWAEGRAPSAASDAVGIVIHACGGGSGSHAVGEGRLGEQVGWFGPTLTVKDEKPPYRVIADGAPADRSFASGAGGPGRSGVVPVTSGKGGPGYSG